MSPITDYKLHLLLNQLIFVLIILSLSCKNADIFHKQGKDLGISIHTSVNWDNIAAFLKWDGLHVLLLLTYSTSH